MSSNQDEYIRLECPRCSAPLQFEGENLYCPYCGARLIPKRATSVRQNTAPTGTPVTGAPATSVSGFSFKPFTYIDPQSGVEVFSLQIPQGWRVNGGVTWVTARPAAPVLLTFQAANPDGLEAFEILPNQYFTWMNNPLIQMTKPPGSLYFGFEVRQPVPARDAMRMYILPRCRSIPDLVIAEEGQAVELQQAVTGANSQIAQGVQYSNDSVRVRLHYTLNGQPVAEEMSCVTEYHSLPKMGIDMLNWNIGFLTSFRAGREGLERYADLYRAILTSIKFNPAWNSLVLQVIQGLTNSTIRHINQIGALSRQISRNANEISDMSMRGWQERSASSDRIAEKFSQTIRGVDSYYDPNAGHNVELPTGYDQAWSTPLGEYIISDDPNYNPNIGSTKTWTPLEPPEE